MFVPRQELFKERALKGTHRSRHLEEFHTSSMENLPHWEFNDVLFACLKRVAKLCFLIIVTATCQ